MMNKLALLIRWHMHQGQLEFRSRRFQIVQLSFRSKLILRVSTRMICWPRVGTSFFKILIMIPSGFFIYQWSSLLIRVSGPFQSGRLNKDMLFHKAGLLVVFPKEVGQLSIQALSDVASAPKLLELSLWSQLFQIFKLKFTECGKHTTDLPGLSLPIRQSTSLN